MHSHFDVAVSGFEKGSTLGIGLVYKEDISSNMAVAQLVFRLRSEIRGHTVSKDVKIIENDGSGSYRLSVPPEM